jgi:hypothetical protein
MARISKYTQDTTLSDKDLLAGSNYISGSLGEEVYSTTNFTLGKIASYIGGGSSKRQKQFIISPTELNSFNNNSAKELTLLEAPGEKKIIIVYDVSVLKYFPSGGAIGETDYAFVEDLAVTVRSNIGNSLNDTYSGHRVTIDTGILNDAGSNIGRRTELVYPFSLTLIQDLSNPTNFFNAPLKLMWKNQQTGDHTVGGDGSWSLVLVVNYSILDWTDIL